MPVATVDINDTKQYDLKSAPPDGYVVLRRLSYGQWLQRQEMAMSMKVEGSQGKGNATMDMAMLQRQVAQFEFANCIISHNLTDANLTPLNFGNPGTIQLLDPKIGQEIASYIDDLNVFDEERLGNSEAASNVQSNVEAAQTTSTSPSTSDSQAPASN